MLTMDHLIADDKHLPQKYSKHDNTASENSKYDKKNYAKREEARVGCGRGHVRETRPSNKKMGNLARDALVRSQTPL